MNSTQQEIVHEVKTKFEELVQYVTEETRDANADQVERHLWRNVLAIGLNLLQLFFWVRKEQASREPMQLETGMELKYIEDRGRTYQSVFGKAVVERPYFYKAGHGGCLPLDAELGLGERSYSDMLQQMESQLSVYVPYGKASKLISGLLGQTYSTRVGQQCVLT